MTLIFALHLSGVFGIRVGMCIYVCAFVYVCIYMYGVSQEERSIFWEVIVSVILSKNVYMNMCPIPNGFRDRAVWMYNRKIVDKKEVLRVRTVSNTDIYCSSDSVGTVNNRCSKIPPSTSMHFAPRVKTWRVVRLSASWHSFMQAITSSMLTSSSSRVSAFFLYTSLLLSMCGAVWSMTCWLFPLFYTIVWQDKIT